MDAKSFDFWNSYLDTLKFPLVDPYVEASVAGTHETTDELLALYLAGKKTAGSSLKIDYELAGDDLPEIGNFWIILDSKDEPRCIVKTIRVEHYKFREVPLEVAIAEGEGDSSLEYWRKVHIEFFTPFLPEWNVTDLESETLITEFYEVVFKRN